MSRLRIVHAIIPIVLLALPTAGTARVEVDFAKPDVSYSATRVMQIEQGTYRQRFHYVPQKTRSEMTTGGRDVVTITRDDLSVIWVFIDPNTYLETSMDDPETYGDRTAGSPDAMEVTEYTEVGRETVNGFETTKYRVRAEDADGDEMLGHFWVTDERVPVRMEMDFQLETEDRRSTIVVWLEDLVIGPQDAALFEVPANAQKIDMAGIPGFSDGSFQEQLKQSASDGVSQGANEAVKETARDRVKDGMKKGLKKLFGG
jgi:hypothetical protein